MSVDDTLSALFQKQLDLKSDDKCMETPYTPYTKPALQTEDTGKMFEMAICKAYNITYNGKYKYSYDLAERLQPRLEKLKAIFPQCIHTAQDRSPYDFTAEENSSLHLSAKTVKKGVAKVAPQVVGQAAPKTLCTHLGISYTTDEALKCYIQENVPHLLDLMTNHTFGCPNIYFHQQKDTIKYITMTRPIDWSAHQYTWTRDWKQWNNSTICKILLPNKSKPVSIAEFQFHSKSRKNMAIRWFYDNILELFKDHMEITDI
jgi:hypothetical protein